MDISSSEIGNGDPTWLNKLTSIRSNACSELDRENSHFEVADAIIVALEQLHATHDEESDEEEDLPPDIRDYTFSLTSGASGSWTSSSSPLSPVIVRKSPQTDPALSLNKDMNDWEIANACSPLDHSISAVLEKFAVTQAKDRNSPEALARKLFQTYSITAEESAELDWLVSEKSHPQKERATSEVLPSLRLRGTSDWAPPRAQIIYHLHPPSTRKALMMRAGFRCAGCGMKIDPALAKCFRYCAYLGKYFCHSCHHQTQSMIPARILHKWDFRLQPVSNFAKELLDNMFSEPMFSIVDTNNNLYKNVADMRYSRALRYQLFFLNEYLKTCRNGVHLIETMPSTIKKHIIDEPQCYSMEDLLAIKGRTLLLEMKVLVTNWLNHVDNCGLCKGKGFICELCEDNAVIYPFQLEVSYQCQMCWACYHKNCYSNNGAKCTKCSRIQARKQLAVDPQLG